MRCQRYNNVVPTCNTQKRAFPNHPRRADDEPSWWQALRYNLWLPLQVNYQVLVQHFRNITLNFYRPQTKFRARSYFYTCVSFCSGGGRLASQHASQVTWPASRIGLLPSMHHRSHAQHSGGSASRGMSASRLGERFCLQGSWANPLGTRKVGGTHLTGMVFCFVKNWSSLSSQTQFQKGIR